MCGITGVVRNRRLLPRDVRSVGAMNAALTHRGPGGAGEYWVAMRRMLASGIDRSSKRYGKPD